MVQTGDERSREVRIGLVMYGGVSLAIYMNGVADELFRAVRGRGVYKLFKALTDSDVVVDVVSGASAGGINGMFLAFALCNECEFSACAELWRNQGDIMKLLRHPGSPVQSQTSLLDSEGYYEPQLAGAFRQMWSSPRAAQAADAPSRVSELDLFIAGTDFNGRRSTSVDSAAHVIDVKDHRTQFWLKHRDRRKHQLDPRADPLGKEWQDPRETSPSVEAERRGALEAGFAAFAKLARITSCFPGAFSPVPLDVPEPRAAAAHAADDVAVAHKLGVWGALAPGKYYFLDGGILDNKPFTSTIETIFYRMANRPVQRHLLYVEPDPERFESVAVRAPTFLTSAFDSLTRLPAYESIAADLQLIGKHNDAIERYKRTCSELRNWVMIGPSLPQRERNGAGDATGAIYERARLHSLAELAGRGLLNAEPMVVAVDAAKERMAALRHAFDAAVARAKTEARGRGPAAASLFAQYDVEFRLRRLMHLTYVLMPRVREDGAGAGADAERARGPAAPTPVELLEARDAREALRQIGHRIALLEIVKAKLLRAIERSAPSWQRVPASEIWNRVMARLDAVLDTRGMSDAVLSAIAGETACEDQLQALRDVLERRTDPSYQPSSSEPASLLVLSDKGEAELVARFLAPEDRPRPEWLPRGAPHLPVKHEFDRFEGLDRVLFPMQFVANLHEQDIIRTVRVSPLDAQRGCSAGKLADKVTGETLAHFGAFLKRSWRSNDILYGRLDGACQLIETLLNPSWLRTSLADVEQRKSVLRSFGVTDEHAADPATRSAAVERWLLENDIFPGAGAAALARAVRALSLLLDPSSAPPFPERIAGRPYQELLDALVEATHFSIMQSDYAKLIEDSIKEQLDWRTGRVTSQGQEPEARRKPRFDAQTRAFDVELDDLALEAAARQFAKDALHGKQEPQTLAALQAGYRVGAESIRDDIPKGVLLELTAHALLILRNCIIGSFGSERANAVRENRFYRVFVDWPLRAFHALAVQIRQRPAHGGISLGLLAYFVLAVVVDVCFFGSLWELGGWRGYLAMLVFVALPLGCLAAAAGLIMATDYSWRSVQSAYLRLARSVLYAITVAGAVVVALAPIYVASKYLAVIGNELLEPVLCPFEQWLPGSCREGGDIAVLAATSAVSITVGIIAGRQWRARAEKAKRQRDGIDTDGNPPAASSRRGAAAGEALPAPAE